MKKYFALLLSVIMILSTTIVSFADSSNDFSSEAAKLEPIISGLLETVQNESDVYGLGDVNFDNLYLGEKISVYQEDNSDLKKLSIEYYPIIEKNELVEIATVSYIKNGEPVAQIGEDFSTLGSHILTCWAYINI